MKTLPRIVSIFLCTVISTPAFSADEPGQDNPLVTRFQGATMLGYQESDYDEISLPRELVPYAQYGSGGRNAEAAEEAVLPLEGHITWITYRAPKGKSTLEILRNYEAALTSGEFEVLFSCAQQRECGKGIGRYVAEIVYPEDYSSFRSLPGYVVRGKTRAVLARRSDDSSTAYVFLYLDDDKSPTVIQQVVVEGEPMQTGQVEAGVPSAEELQTALDTEGKAVVEGIFFEHDSSEILPESTEALAQMARLLTDNPDIEVLVVGHTDNKGSFEYNVDLSQRRADAVRRMLSNEYGINVARMSAKGASFMAPIASNNDEQGQELNRRVELVLR